MSRIWIITNRGGNLKAIRLQTKIQTQKGPRKISGVSKEYVLTRVGSSYVCACACVCMCRHLSASWMDGLRENMEVLECIHLDIGQHKGTVFE